MKKTVLNCSCSTLVISSLPSHNNIKNQIWKKCASPLYIWSKYRGSHSQMFYKLRVLKIIFAKFTGKFLCQGLFFSETAGLRPKIQSEKRLRRRFFPVNFTKFLRTPFWENASGRLFWKYLIIEDTQKYWDR